MCTGGDLHKDTFYLSGEWAQRALSEIRLDKAILGVSAIDPQYGVSTVHHADLMLVLDQGRLVQLGTPDELLVQDGLYRQLHEVQTRHSRRPWRSGLADPVARQA